MQKEARLVCLEQASSVVNACQLPRCHTVSRGTCLAEKLHACPERIWFRSKLRMRKRFHSGRPRRAQHGHSRSKLKMQTVMQTSIVGSTTTAARSGGLSSPAALLPALRTRAGRRALVVRAEKPQVGTYSSLCTASLRNQ